MYKHPPLQFILFYSILFYILFKFYCTFNLHLSYSTPFQHHSIGISFNSTLHSINHTYPYPVLLSPSHSLLLLTLYLLFPHKTHTDVAVARSVAREAVPSLKGPIVKSSSR